MKNMDLTPLYLTLLCITMAIIVPVLNAPSTLAQANMSSIRDSTILARLPNQNSSQYRLTCMSCASSRVVEDVVNIEKINSRDELINSVSSYNQLHEILDKFKDFIDAPGSPGASVSIPSHDGSINIYYSWYPEKVIRENNSILMLKFTNSSGGPITNKKIDYDISITNGTNFNFQKNGSTTTGVDMKVIGGNTFPQGPINKPVDYNVSINILAINGIANMISSPPHQFMKATVL